MKKVIGIISVFVLIFSQQITAQKNQPTKKAIFILLDGIPSDVIEMVNTPNLDEISALGGYTKAHVGGEKNGYSQTPTISAPGYNCLLTGTWLNKHNVKGNSITNPNYNYWTIFKMAKESKPSLKTAVFSTWLDNRTKLVEGGTLEVDSFKFDYAFDGFEYDTIQFPHDEGRTYISKIDEHISKEAGRYIYQNGPDLSWMYLEFTDDIGHKFGDSPQFHEAIKLADIQVGRVWKALKERMKKYNEDWMIVVTTDHGRNEETGMGHGGQSERERLIWIVTNKNTNAHFNDVPGIVSVVPSLLNHLAIEIPENRAFELDGTSFINPIAISDLKLQQVGDKIKLNWKSYGKNQKVEIFVTATNNFKDGGKDEYVKVLSTKSTKEGAEFDVKEMPSNFYKVLVRTKLNSINKWIVATDK